MSGRDKDDVIRDLIKDNENLKKALFETKNKLDEKNNDWKINKEIVEDQKKRLETATEDYREMETKYWRAVDEKDYVEKQAKEDLSKLQDLIARKEREAMEMKSKYLNYIDFELEQKKIENKLEMKYGKDLEEKQRIIDSLNKEINEMIRENEINKSKLSLIQKDHEDRIAVLKNLNKKQIDLLTAELKEYQTQRLFDEYKPRYEEMKIKKEEAERTTGLFENEVLQLKADLHNTKIKFNQAVVDHAREIEKLRAEGWNFKNEKDKILFRNESLEQENADLKSSFNGYEKKIVELTNEVLDKNKLVAQKERELEELHRKQIDLENESISKQRSLKQLYEEQANSTRLQHAQDIKSQQEELRIYRENVNRLEERVKSVLASEQSKDRQILELERNVASANDKINGLNRQLKEEKDKFDRIALDNEGSFE